jgi:23S rRNA (guanosine2251-2'-O)-methyltransferase
MPVLEALDDTALRVDKVILAEDLRGEPVRGDPLAARARGVRVERASAHRVKVLAGNGRHDQGVLADVVAPRMEPVDEFLARIGSGGGAGVGAGPAHQPGERRHDPAQRHRGRARRGAAAPPRPARHRPARGEGVGRGGVPGAGAAGGDRRGGLRGARRGRVRGLRARRRRGRRCSRRSCPRGSQLVLGNETNGLSESVRPLLAGLLAIPMHAGVESLGVASAGAVAAFELARRPR